MKNFNRSKGYPLVQFLACALFIGTILFKQNSFLFIYGGHISNFSNKTILVELNRKVADYTLSILSIVLIPMLALSLLRVIDQGWLPVMWLHICLVSGSIICYFYRNNLSINFKSIYIIVMFIGFGTGASIHNQAVVYSSPFYVVSLIFILVFYSRFLAYLVLALMFLGQLILSYSIHQRLKIHDILMLTAIPVFAFVVAYIAKMIKDILFQVISEIDDLREQALASSTVKKHFVSTINHEFRTPMNGILIAVQKLEEIPELPVRAQRYHHIIETCSSTLLELINNVLDFSKLEEKKIELQDQEVNIIQLIKDVAEVFQIQNQNTQIQLELILPKDKSLMVYCDSAKLRQILMNLVGNAFKFTRQGRVSITLNTIVDNENVNIEVIVQDTGIGIKSEDIPIIFHNFKQLDSSHNRQYQGVGLGLAIVHSLVQLMNGQIEVYSELNKGTTFNLKLAFKAVSKTLDMPAMSVDSAKSDFANKKLLLVEDNNINMELLIDLLSDFGFKQMDQAVNGLMALEKCKSNKYDLILMDMQMPVMDGVRATEQIRQNSEYSLNKVTPIYMISANSSKVDQQNFIKAGCSGSIAKPINVEKMQETLKSIFN